MLGLRWGKGRRSRFREWLVDHEFSLGRELDIVLDIRHGGGHSPRWLPMILNL